MEHAHRSCVPRGGLFLQAAYGLASQQELCKALVVHNLMCSMVILYAVVVLVIGLIQVGR